MVAPAERVSGGAKRATRRVGLIKPSYMRLLTPYFRNMSSADIESYASYVSAELSKSRLANSQGIIVKRSASVSVLHACMPLLTQLRGALRAEVCVPKGVGALMNLGAGT